MDTKQFVKDVVFAFETSDWHTKANHTFRNEGDVVFVTDVASGQTFKVSVEKVEKSG